ncbi:MAG TPA: autotransporter domain-containing protein [Methylophaga aminisulfidivorans]|uniref:autotransporter-associated beta strand repeat-containing protein n=2 Tax=Piscirickettsiaceae TaxID=135616 RepID=UPI001A12C365|nr:MULTISPECIES: autotransporter-associated beta strand repeat-containing protein [Methylophaga]HIM39854.1 autotransporter domain-containing protein [Methylophaga aminisulfidivorans]
MKSPNQIFTKAPRSKLKPLVAAMLPLMAFGIHNPVLAAVIDYTNGEEKTDAIALTDNSTQLQVTAGTATQSGSIGGDFDLEKIGAGTLIFSGMNSYRGDTNISAGTLRIANIGAIPNTSGTVNVSAGAFFDIATSVSIDDFTGAGTTSINTSQTLTIGVNGSASSQNIEYSGVITGAGNLYSYANRTLSGNNSYTGTTTVDKGTVIVSATGDINESSAISITANGTLNVDGGGNAAIGDTVAITNAGNFILTGSDETIGSITGAGNINLNNNTLTTGSDGTSTTVSGVISGPDGRLTKEGAGTFTLSGANTYTGATTINAGTLQAANASALGKNSAVTVNGGSLDLTTDLSIGSLAGAGNVTLNANTLTTGSNNSSTTYSGVLSGNGALIKQGTGTTTLSGTNTYTGGTTINDGAIRIGAADNLGSGALTLDGGTLQTTASFTSSRGTTLGASGGSFNIDAGTTLSQSGQITGSGRLSKTGEGTLTLSGTNTYTGGTTINDGTILIGAADNLGSGALTLDGGTLQTTASFTSNRGTTLGASGGSFNIETSTTLTQSGNISGSGRLSKTGEGTLTLSGTNTYTGGTTIDDGTLQIGNGGTSGTLGTGNVTNNSALVFNRSDDSSYTGVISGTGTVSKDGAGTLTLSGNNTYSGTTTISDGTLQVGNGGTSGTLGNGNVTNNSALVFNRSDDSSYNGVISGTGTVSKDGAGTLTLSGTNTYSGGTTINDGTISIGALANLGSGALTLDGGTLQTTSSFTSNRGTTLGASGGSFNIDAGITLTQSANISGSGSLTKTGEGTLVLSGSNNSFTGGTVVADGRLIALDGGAIAKAGNITNNAIVEFQIGLNASEYHYDQISGTGSLIKSGAGNVVLNGNNTYTGGTTISEGILSIGGTAGSITGDILNNGELRLLRTNDYTFAGDISGTGSVSNYLSGTTTLTGNNTYSGITYIRDGILQIGDGGTSGTLGTGNVTNNSALVFNRSDDSGYAGVISGTGSVTKEGVGNFNLTGTNTYTGATTVNAGILSVNGSISNSTTTVNSGGTLGGTGTVGDVFINGGTFAPGNSIGTINVSGNVDFSGGGNYDVEVDAAGNSDKIVATGSATLTSGIVNVKAAPGTYAYATDYTILTASGGLGGTTFDSVNADLAFLTPTLSYDANNVFLKLTRNDVSFNDVASTRNQQAVAQAVDSNINDLSSLVSQITPLSSLAARQAFDSLSGVQHSNNQLISRSVSSQFNKLLLNHGSQSASGSLAFNAQSPNATGYNSGSASQLLEARGWWTQGFGSFNKIDDTNNARGADYQTTGLALGFDVDWNDFVMGVAGSYARTDVDPYSGNSTIDSYQAATYGSWQQDKLYVNASVGLGLHQVDASRTVIMGSSVSTAKADYDSFDINSTIETGKDFALGADTTLTPFAGVSYLYNTRESFTEKGAGSANLKVDKENDESLQTSIGLRVSHNIQMKNNRVLTPVASIAYVHEHMDSVTEVDARFNGVPSSSFVVEGPDLDRDRLQLGLGISGELTSSTRLVLGYYGEFAESHQNNAFSATLDMAF